MKIVGGNVLSISSLRSGRFATFWQSDEGVSLSFGKDTTPQNKGNILYLSSLFVPGWIWRTI